MLPANAPATIYQNVPGNSCATVTETTAAITQGTKSPSPRHIPVSMQTNTASAAKNNGCPGAGRSSAPTIWPITDATTQPYHIIKPLPIR